MIPINKNKRGEDTPTDARLPVAERLESLEGLVTIARQSLESLPTISQIVLARTPAARIAIDAAIRTAVRWIESTSEDLKSNTRELGTSIAKTRCEELAVEISQMKKVVDDRLRRTASIWEALGGCPERAPVLLRSDMGELVEAMVERRQAFWAILYSFPSAVEERLHTFQRCISGDANIQSFVFKRWGDSRTAEDLLSQAEAVLRRFPVESLNNDLNETTVHDRTLGDMVSKLPALPEVALELSANIERQVERIVRESPLADAQSASDEQLQSSREEIAIRLGEMVKVRDEYLLLKSYAFAANVPLADRQGWLRARKLATHNHDDVYQAARLGLLKAIERWDPQAGAAFSTFSSWWIRQTSEEESRSVSGFFRIPEAALPCYQALRRLSNSELRELDVDAFAAQCGVDREIVMAARTVVQGVKSQTVRDHHEGSRDRLASVTDTRASAAEQSSTASEAKETIDRLLPKLSARHQRVLRLKFGLGGDGVPLNLRELGERLGVSRERARQLELQALTRLRRIDS